MSRTALLVIDIQNDYFPGGKMELERAAAAAARAQSFEGREIAAVQVHGAFLGALRGVYAKIMPTEEFLTTL